MYLLISEFDWGSVILIALVKNSFFYIKIGLIVSFLSTLQNRKPQVPSSEFQLTVCSELFFYTA